MEIPVMNIFVEAKQGLYEDNMIDVNIQSVCPSSDQQSWERSQSQFKGHWVRNQSEIATGTWQSHCAQKSLAERGGNPPPLNGKNPLSSF